MSIRDAFIEAFDEANATAIEAAAEEHKNGIHDRPGSDYFRWAIVIAIGYECMEKDGYREYHGITAPWPALHDWIRDHANLADHDGDSDYLSMMAGTYNEFVSIEVPS